MCAPPRVLAALPQVLQTLSILIQNLRTQQTVYYLFSNNHINDIVSMRFDFEDDEVLVGAPGAHCCSFFACLCPVFVSEGARGACWSTLRAVTPHLSHPTPPPCAMCNLMTLCPPRCRCRATT